MTLYLDTSSLVKLYVAEKGSDDVWELVTGADIVATSAIAYPEARAALARRRRERVLTASVFAQAKRAFDTDWPRYLAIDVTSALCQRAGDLAERHRLRGYDSVHLASFLEVVGRADEVMFSSFDEDLNRVARSATRAVVTKRPNR